jgi:hypothetical protein
MPTDYIIAEDLPRRVRKWLKTRYLRYGIIVAGEIAGDAADE